MSKLFTAIAVDVASVEKLIREVPGSHISAIRYNDEKSRVEILWEQDAFLSGFDFPVEFTPEQLLKKLPPKHIKIDIKRMRELEKLPPPAPEPEELPEAEFQGSEVRGQKSEVSGEDPDADAAKSPVVPLPNNPCTEEQAAQSLAGEGPGVSGQESGVSGEEPGTEKPAKKANGRTSKAKAVESKKPAA